MYFIHYIEAYFTFALVDYVRYKEDFIKSRFIKYRFCSVHFTVILAVLKKKKLYRGLCYIEVHLTEVPLVIYPVCSTIHLLNNYACHFDAALNQRLQYSYGRCMVLTFSSKYTGTLNDCFLLNICWEKQILPRIFYYLRMFKSF